MSGLRNAAQWRAKRIGDMHGDDHGVHHIDMPRMCWVVGIASIEGGGVELHQTHTVLRSDQSVSDLHDAISVAVTAFRDGVARYYQDKGQSYSLQVSILLRASPQTTIRNIPADVRQN